MAESDVKVLQGIVARLAKSCDENTGRAIGIAAVLAALPEVGSVDTERVKKIIDRMLKNFVGASDETRAAANSVSTMIIATATVARRKPGATKGDHEDG